MMLENTDELAILTGRDRERLMLIIEFALNIRRRNQFFQWTQGHLQALIPHEIIYCAYGRPLQRNFNTVCYGTALREGKDADPGETLLYDALELWRARGGQPLQLAAEADGIRLPEPLRTAVRESRF